MKFEGEAEFNAAFQRRLKETRAERGWTHAQLATGLQLKLETYKKYENRLGSTFPIHLLPRLALITDKPVAYWLGAPSVNPSKLRIVR